MVRKLANYIFMKTSIVTNKLNTHYFITSTKLKLLTLLMVFLSSWGWGQTVTIGSGTNATVSGNSNPIDGSYNSFRYQVIYTASELTAAGMPANSEINGLGFSISGDYGGGNLLGYKIRMGHTLEVNSAIHNTAVLTEVKNSFSYNPTVTAAGAFDMISFNTNFTWDGTSNIVIDICSDGSNPYTSPYGSVRIISSSTTNGSRCKRVDSGGSQCGINTSAINTTKPQIRFSYTPPPCSGTPAPGNTIASSNLIAIGSSSVLSLQNATSGSGVTYQWKYSLDNVTYTNISGATNATYTASPTVSTYYLCDVTCSGSTISSNAVLVNLITCYVPTALTSSSITYQTATISWSAPVTGTSPANYEYEVRTSGTASSGVTGLVTSGSISAPSLSANLTGLSANTSHSFYVRSNCGAGDFSSWSSAASFTTLKTEPSNQITALAAGTVTNTDIPLIWTAAIAGTQAPDGYLIKASNVDLNSVTDPVDGTDPANVTVFTSNAANKKQTTGTATSTTTFTGTAPGTMYYYKVYSYSNSGTGIDFKTDNPASLSHATKPNTVSSTLTAETITSSSIGFSWSSTSYLSATNEYLIFAKAGSAVTVGTPTQDPALYTASATFGNGTVYQGDANAFCVYKGDGTSINLTGLTASSTYYFLIYAVVSNANSNGSFSYATGTSVNRTTPCAPISSFPWTEGFENVTTGTTVVGTSTSLPNCWNSQSTQWASSNSTTYNTAKTGTKYIRYAYSSTNAYIWTPGFQLTAGISYDFSFYAQGDGFTGWNNDIFVNLSVTSTGATQLTPTYTPSGTGTASIQSYYLVTRTFVPSTSGVYYFAIRGNQSSSSPWYMAIDDFKLEPTPTSTWTGATSTDWNTASNWSPASVPFASAPVIIPTNGITNFPVATSLTIAYGGSTTLNSNARLTVNGTLTNNGTLTLESGATLVQGTGNTVAGSGTFNVKQALTGAGGSTPSGRFWYLGSPVSGATSTVFNAAGDNRLWTFAEATQSYTEITTNGVSMSPMQGHVARLGANETSIFTGGLLNTGNYTNSSLTNTGTGSTRGYTLLSNPYPSYLDWTAAYTAAVATNVNLSSSIWYRSNDGTNMVYDIYNATGAIATNNSGGTTTQYIPPMQAFWVYNPNDGTTGSVTFSNSMRSHQNNGGLKSITDFPAFVRLNLENDGAIDQTVLYFDNNAATGYDNFDSDKMMVSNAAQVYSFVDNKKLAINGMKSVKTNKQVPLTVEFPTAKSYSFNATEVAMTDGIVLLEDRLMNVFQDLTMNPVYAFDAVAGTDANRFVVHFQANSGVAGIETAEDNGIDIVSNASGLVTITLSEELPAMGTIQIIDINGKVIATQAINEHATTININVATGVYHVLVDSSAKVARKKIVITK